MAISNKFGAMVVTTGNKSEMSVGYATLYGDMNGGFNPIKDLYKMEVFRLVAPCATAGSRSARSGPTARSSRANIITKPPSRRAAREPEGRGFAAALSGARRHPGRAGREGDARRRHRRRGLRPRDGAQGRAAALSRRIQAPPVGARASRSGPKNFGRDRRYPIVNRFRDPGVRRRRRPDASIAPRGGRGDERAVRGVGVGGAFTGLAKRLIRRLAFMRLRYATTRGWRTGDG